MEICTQVFFEKLKMDITRTIGQKWLANELVLFFDPEELCQSTIQSDNFFQSYYVYRRQTGGRQTYTGVKTVLSHSGGLKM